MMTKNKKSKSSSKEPAKSAKAVKVRTVVRRKPKDLKARQFEIESNGTGHYFAHVGKEYGDHEAIQIGGTIFCPILARDAADWLVKAAEYLESRGK